MFVWHLAYSTKRQLWKLKKGLTKTFQHGIPDGCVTGQRDQALPCSALVVRSYNNEVIRGWLGGLVGRASGSVRS